MTQIDSNIDSTEKQRGSDMRIAGILLVVASLISVVGILHHPTADGLQHEHEMFGDAAHATRFMHHLNALVHGTLVVVIATFVLSTSYLASLMGSSRLCVRAGTITYVFGGLCMIVAATIDGFVYWGVVEELSDAGNDDFAHAIGHVLLDILRVMALMGVLSMSLGILFWSVSMLRQTTPMRMTAAIGMVVAVIGMGGVASGNLEATHSGMIAFVAMQTLWNTAVAIRLIRSSAR